MNATPTLPETDGLNAEEVLQSRQVNGRNVLPQTGRHFLHILRGVFLEPMFLLLLVAGSLYFITHQYQEGTIMLVALAVVAGISVFQEIRSEHALRALREMTQPLVKVRRGGTLVEIPVDEIVVGDLVICSEGERLPADGELISFNDLSIDESLLTGESMPVTKNKSGDPVYSGTLVVAGSGMYRVSHVGVRSQIGRLGQQLVESSEVRTPMQRQVDVFVRGMALIGSLAFLMVCFIHYASSGDFLHSIFHGLTLAMAVVPEEIPVAVSAFMALGAFRMVRKRILVRHPQTVEALGAATVICVDKTGTITANRMHVESIYVHKTRTLVDDFSTPPEESSLSLVRIAEQASERDAFDPMEQAIIRLSQELGLPRRDQDPVKEYPLSGVLPRMTHVFRQDNNEFVVAVKGAAEGILADCDLSPEERTSIEGHLHHLSAKGFRLLAIAEGVWSKEKVLPESQFDFPLRLQGLLALSDPVKPNIPEVLASFRQAGVDVKMITGDYPATASHIAAIAGFPHPNRVVTGQQVQEMSSDELAQAVQDVEVFARARPETKMRLIETLKARGEVVAMTGDGVNDAPALKAAHIGVAMGKRGSEVARQSSSLVLLDDDLSAMVEAISDGRRIYSNIKKAIQYIISIHIPMLCLVVVPLVLGWEYISLFTPIHIIFMEMVMGPTCSIVFENEPLEAHVMRQRPKKFTTRLFSQQELARPILQGLVIALVMLVGVRIGTESGLSETIIRTMAFIALMTANGMLTLTGRSNEFTLWTTLRYPNRLLLVALLLTVLITTALLWVPFLRNLFTFERLSAGMIILSMGIGIISVIWIEGYKWLKRH